MSINLNTKYFLISFSLGILFVYLFTPQPRVIIKFPTPDNAGKIIYKDNNDVCYKYKATEVQCPLDKSLINKLPIQHNNNSNN